MIAIDAANSALIRQWAAEGVLPHIQSMMESGLTGETKSVEGFFVGSTWPSFYTGTNPAKHGFHGTVQLKAGTYEFGRFAHENFVRREPFWNSLSRAGRRVAILDVPLSQISGELNGIQTVEWGSHDAVFGFRTWPPRLRRDIHSRFGPHPLVGSCDADRSASEDFRKFRSTLISGIEKKTDLTLYLLSQGDWDFFTQVFTEAHCAGHQCWHFQDPAHPAYDPAAVAAIGNPLKDVYVAIDKAIGKLKQAAGKNTLVLLITLHGMAHRYGAQFLLPEILQRLKVTYPREEAASVQGQSHGAVETLAWCWRHLPQPVRQQLRPAREWVSDWLAGEPSPPTLQADPKLSKCFPVDNGLAMGGIRLNLAGREPLGLLQPGTEAEVFCEQLSKQLLEITNQQNGQPLIRQLRRTADLYTGNHLDDLPDLLVEWNDDAPLGTTAVGVGRGAVVRAASPQIGVIEGVNGYCRTGEHRIAGMFVATGPTLNQGRLDRIVSIMDFAPTFGGLLGADIGDCDGRPIPELACVPVR